MRNERERARPIKEAEAEELIQGICFKNGPPRRTGVELEWLLHDPDDPLCPVGPDRLDPAVAEVRALPLRSTVTTEPGGQLELSSPPSPSPDDCITVVTSDLALVRGALKGHGLVLTGHGHDPWRAPRRVLTEPRYAAMETYLDRFGSAGRSMMCLGQRHLRPAPVGSCPEGASPHGVRQLIGDVWEWTASDFLPYPGFAAFPYREYSEVFFGSDHKVLRGGSFAVDPVACRGTFRNWDYPIRRQIFSGFRTARDAKEG